jgi:hypothetical protein
MNNKKTNDSLDEIKEIDANPYELDKFSKIPSWIKIFFLKYWAAAAAVFFFLISNFLLDFTEFEDAGKKVGTNFALDFTVILFLCLGLTLFFTYIVRPIVRFMFNRQDNTFKYNMVNVRGLWALPINFAYMFIVSILIYPMQFIFTVKWGINTNLFGQAAGIDPFTYGLMFLIVDTIFISIKNFIIMIYQRISYKKQINAE